MTAHAHHGLLPSVQSMLNIIVIAVFIVTFIAQPFRIPSESMEPTLLVGDFLLVNKQVFSPRAHANPLPQPPIRRGDIIVFHYPVDANLHLVKRVVGLPGDRVHLHDNRVYINETALPEPYAVYGPSMPDEFRDDFPSLRTADPSINAAWWTQLRSLLSHGEITVPPDEFFVLGDNRNDSEDSRYWGFVPRANIVGQPFLVYFSLRESTPGVMPSLPAQPSGKRQQIAEAFNHLARWGRVGHIIR